MYKYKNLSIIAPKRILKTPVSYPMKVKFSYHYLFLLLPFLICLNSFAEDAATACKLLVGTSYKVCIEDQVCRDKCSKNFEECTNSPQKELNQNKENCGNTFLKSVDSCRIKVGCIPSRCNSNGDYKLCLQEAMETRKQCNLTHYKNWETEWKTIAPACTENRNSCAKKCAQNQPKQ